MKPKFHQVVLAACTALICSADAVAAEVPLVTGDQWVHSTAEAKKA